MTEPLPTDVPGAADARRARLAELTGRASPRRRRHPAQGARIAAAGLGATALFGLVGAMAYGHPPAAPPSPPSPTASTAASAGPGVVVVVHHAGGPDTVAPPVSARTAGGTDGRTGSAATTRLAARPATRPTVRPASRRSSAPAASTSGSH